MLFRTVNAENNFVWASIVLETRRAWNAGSRLFDATIAFSTRANSDSRVRELLFKYYTLTISLIKKQSNVNILYSYIYLNILYLYRKLSKAFFEEIKVKWVSEARNSVLTFRHSKASFIFSRIPWKSLNSAISRKLRYFVRKSYPGIPIRILPVEFENVGKLLALASNR